MRAAFPDELAAALRAGYSLVAVPSWEEERVEAVLAAIAQGSKRKLEVWSALQGGAVETLARIAEDPGPSLWLLKDVHPFLSDPLVVRSLRDIAGGAKASAHPVVLVGPVLSIPRELEKDVAVVELPLPSAQELEKVLREVATQAGAADAVEPAAADAARGLTLREAKRAFRRALDLRKQGVARELVPLVVAEKRKALRNTRFLEYWEPSGAADSLGGLGELKRWLAARGAAFKAEARAFGLPQPKGVFLLGVQGCGKSLAAKAAAEMWSLPLLRFDAGAVIDGGGGDGPAANLRQALGIAEALAPSVLWIDEVEKVFATSAMQESSATSRVLGSFVTWLQEKTSPVFVVATANRVDALPPELLRKGRFDEIFFVDLPGLHDRKEILQIHLARRGRRPDQFDAAALAKATEKFSGAELEAAVVAALFSAFSEGRELEPRDLKQAIDETVPLAITMEEEIRALKDWAKARTRPAALDTRRADLFGGS